MVDKEKANNERGGREKGGKARRRYSRQRAREPLSRYWNGKWNIRNKSCKTPFSRDNAVSSLWTLARVGRAYCATLGGQRGWCRSTNEKRQLEPVSLEPVLPGISSFLLWLLRCPSVPGSPLTIFLPPSVLYFGSTTTTNTTTTIAFTTSTSTSNATLFHPLGLLRDSPGPSMRDLCSSLFLVSTADVHLLPLSLFSSFRLFRFDSWNSSASRCRWVNTNGVREIFAWGGRKEWSYSKSGTTSVPPFQFAPASRLSPPCSRPAPRCDHSAKFLKRDNPQYNATLETNTRQTHT